MISNIKKIREKLFNDLKILYEENILTYDLSLKNAVEYNKTYLYIVTMLESLKATKAEIIFRLGEDFYKWFFETHDSIMNDFWNKFDKEN